MSLAIALELNKAGYISLQQIEEAMNAHIVTGGTVLAKLIELGFIDDKQLASCLATEHNFPLADANDFNDVQEDALNTITYEQALDKRIFPLKKNGDYLYLAMFDPTNKDDITALREQIGLKIVPVVAADSQLQEAIQRYYLDKLINNIKDNDVGSDLENGWDKQVTEDMNELDFSNEASPLSGNPSAGAADDNTPAFSYASFEFAQDEGESFSIASALAHAAASLPSHHRATHEEEIKVEDIFNKPTPPALINEGTGISPDAGNEADVIPVVPNPVTKLTVFEQMAHATSREEIANITIEYAKDYWPRVMLLIEKQNYLRVWTIGGEELAGRSDLASMKIPLHQSSQFRKVFNQAQPFLGTLSATSRLYDSFFRRLGGPMRPQRTVMIPIYVGKRVIGLFYADSGSQNPVQGDISELYQLIDAIANAFERLISLRHRQLSQI